MQANWSLSPYPFSVAMIGSSRDARRPKHEAGRARDVQLGLAVAGGAANIEIRAKGRYLMLCLYVIHSRRPMLRFPPQTCQTQLYLCHLPSPLALPCLQRAVSWVSHAIVAVLC